MTSLYLFHQEYLDRKEITNAVRLFIDTPWHAILINSTFLCISQATYTMHVRSSLCYTRYLERR